MGMVSRGAMKYSCVSLYPVFMRTLSCFTAICSVRQCYRGVDLVLMRQELWHPHYEQNWCAALPLPFGCVCTHMTWKTFWVLTALQSVTHTLHSHDLRATTSAEVGASFSGWLQIVYSCSCNSLPVCLWPALLSLSRSRHMGTNEVSEEMHVCAFVYAHFFITNRAGNSVYLKLPGTSHYKNLISSCWNWTICSNIFQFNSQPLMQKFVRNMCVFIWSYQARPSVVSES